MLLERYAESSKYSLRETYIRLRRRGLPPALINERLSNWDINFEYQAALKIAQKYFNSKRQEDLHKIIRRLSAKGFKAPTVSKVLAALRDMSP
jgi:SOS response regulatory protein OraA/RecX